MGVSTSFAQLEGKLAAASGAVSEVQNAATVAGAAFLKAAVEARAPRRLRNVGRGANLEVSTKVFPGPPDSKALVKAKGPWQIIEYDTKPHRIPKSVQWKTPIKFKGIVRWSAHHPGTKGKHPWAQAMEAAVPQLPKVYSAATVGAMHAVF